MVQSREGDFNVNLPPPCHPPPFRFGVDLCLTLGVSEGIGFAFDLPQSSYALGIFCALLQKSWEFMTQSGFK